MSDSILIFHLPITFPYISKSNSTCCAHTVPTNEIGTVYQFRPLLTRRLTALRVFSFYFLISNLVAVGETGVKRDTGSKGIVGGKIVDVNKTLKFFTMLCKSV